MSAFVVNKETIENIVVGLEELKQVSSFKSVIEEFFKSINNDYYNLKIDDEWFNEVCQSMLKMNLEAVNYRYSKNDTIEKYNWKFSKPKWFLELEWKNGCYNFNSKIYQLVKSIHCYLYQCSEGNYDETLMYKTLSNIAKLICYWLVVNTKEYEESDWG